MKRNGKRISASLLAMVMVISMVVPMITPVVAAPVVPPGEEGIYYLDPQDSTAQYCDTVTIDVRVNSSILIKAGMLVIDSDLIGCGEIVDCEYNSTEWNTSGTQVIVNSSGSQNAVGDVYIPGGYRAYITFRGPAEKLPGDYSVGEIEVHCNCTSGCLSNLTFYSGSDELYITNETDDYDIPGENGTFTCTAEEVPINVDIRADSITGNIFAVSGYTINPGTVTEDGITIGNQTAMGAMVVYCQENGINVSLIMYATMGEYVIQIGDNASDNNSWMYAVNETSPWVGGAQYGLSGGEKVHWFNYNIPYYQVLTTLNTTSITCGDYLTATVTWKNTTGTYPLNDATVNVTDNVWVNPGTSVGNTGPDGNCTFQWSTPGTWQVYAVDPVHGSGQCNWPTPCFDCCLPDLVITEKYETFVDGGNFTITYMVNNTGCADAGASNTTISIDDVVDVLEDPVPALAAGENYTNTIGPFTMSGDSDTIMVCADGNDAVAESNETNNCLENEFGYPGMPDLEITDIWTEVIKVGNKFNTTIIHYNITNNGDAEAGRSVSNLTVDGNVTKKRDGVKPLAVGETRTTEFFRYRSATPPNTIKVCADFKDRIAESNETNNCREEPYL